MKKVSILFTIVCSLLMQNIHAQTNPLSFDDSLKNQKWQPFSGISRNLHKKSFNYSTYYKKNNSGNLITKGLISKNNIPARGKKSAASNNWEKLDGPYGGDVRGFYKFYNILYVTTNRELYKYQNNKWISLNFENILCSVISSLYINSSGKIFVGCDWGLYYSDDNGLNWKPFQSELGNTGIHEFLQLADGDILLSTNNGIYISKNDALDFTPLSLVNIPVMTISFDNSGNIWAGTNEGIYKSAYPNFYWQKVNLADDYYNKIIFDSRGVVYTYSTYNVYRSFDSGDTWDNLNGYVSDITLYEDELMITGFTHIYLVNDKGVEWESEDSYYYFLDIYVINENELYVGFSAVGAFRYNFTDNKFTPFNDGMNTSSTNDIFIMNDDELLVSPNTGSCYSFTEKGLKWNKINNIGVAHLESGKNNSIFAASGSGIIESNDFGRTWNELNIDITPYFFSSFDISVDNMTICAGTSTGEVYVSSDGGKNFILRKNANYDFVNAIKIINDKTFLIFIDSLYITRDAGLNFTSVYFNDPFSVRDIIVDKDNYIFVSSNDGIYRSQDGIEWSLFHFPDSINYPFANSVIKLRLNNNNLYALLWDGIIGVSKDKAETWQILTNDIINTFAISFDVGNDGYLYCGTQDNGLYAAKYSIINDIASEKPVPDNYQLFQNFPNPFNSATKITYQLPDEGLVTLKIYNLLGQEIAALENSVVKSPGRYDINFTGNNLASGVYIYQLKIKPSKEKSLPIFIATKKFILLK